MIEPKEVGKRLKSLRKARGLTQEQLSDILYVSPNHVYKMESGGRMPSMEICLNICSYFGVSLDYLITGKWQNSVPAKEIIQKTINELQALEQQLH